MEQNNNNVTTPINKGKPHGNTLVLSIDAKNALISIMIILCFLSSIANAFILTLSRRIRGSYGTVLRLSFGLAAADCWTSLIIGVGYTVFSLGFLNGLRHRACIELFIELFRMGGIFTSILHLVWLALNHYQSIEVQHTSRVNLSGRVLTFLMTFSWIAPPTAFFLCFFMVPDQGFSTLAGSDLNTNQTVCNDAFTGGIRYRVTIYALLLTPVVLMICLYLNMIRSLWVIEKQFQLQNRRSRSVQMKRKMLVTIILMIGSFVVGWVPSGTWILLLANESPYRIKLLMRPLILFSISYLVNLLMVLKFFVNPLIYALRIPEINQALREPFTKLSTAQSTFSKSRGSNSPAIHMGTKRTKQLLVKGSQVQFKRKDEDSCLSLPDRPSESESFRHPATSHL